MRSSLLENLFTYIKEGNLKKVQTFILQHPSLLNMHLVQHNGDNYPDINQQTTNFKNLKEFLIHAHDVATRPIIASDTYPTTLDDTQPANNDFKTALIIAIEQQQVPIIEWLIQQGADVNYKYIAGMSHCCNYTPIYQAVMTQNLAIIQLLLHAGVQINTFNSCLEDSPLALAASLGNIDILKMLLASGADINYQGDNSKGYTALMCAARKGDITMVRYLVEHGAHINLENASGNTALYFAQQKNYPELANYLITCGAHAQSA